MHTIDHGTSAVDKSVHLRQKFAISDSALDVMSPLSAIIPTKGVTNSAIEYMNRSLCIQDHLFSTSNDEYYDFVEFLGNMTGLSPITFTVIVAKTQVIRNLFNERQLRVKLFKDNVLVKGFTNEEGRKVQLSHRLGDLMTQLGEFALQSEMLNWQGTLVQPLLHLVESNASRLSGEIILAGDEDIFSTYIPLVAESTASLTAYSKMSKHYVLGRFNPRTCYFLFHHLAAYLDELVRLYYGLFKCREVVIYPQSGEDIPQGYIDNMNSWYLYSSGTFTKNFSSSDLQKASNDIINSMVVVLSWFEKFEKDVNH